MTEPSRFSLTRYVPVWSIALLTIAIIWGGVLFTALRSATEYRATVTSVAADSCVVQWTTRGGAVNSGTVPCSGREVGDVVPVYATDPESPAVADRGKFLLAGGIGLGLTLVPGLIGVAGRLVGLGRMRQLERAAR